jgi:carboxyl-terminal processing protease
LLSPNESHNSALIRTIFVPATVVLVIGSALIAIGDTRLTAARTIAGAYRTTFESYADDLSPKKLFSDAWAGISSILDPYTSFIPAESYQYLQEESTGSFEGIGVEITVRDGLVTVISPIEGSHADEVGLRPGDQVVTVDSVDVRDMDVDYVTSRIRGPAGTRVLLGILRPGVSKPFEVEVERRRVDLTSVPYSGVVDSTAYIKLTRFALNTPYEFGQAVSKVADEGANSLVLDLRGNPGGFMSAAIYVADLFLPAGEVVVATKSRRPWENYVLRSTEDGPLLDIPVVILVDGGSASASEIVAGALQDHDRAVLMGDTTFGKGLVQTSMELYGGNAFRVTTSKYYLPSGRLVHRFSDEDWAGALGVSREEMNTAFKTDAGRSVYGGGGIAPDIEMPAEDVNIVGAALAYGNYFFKFTVDYRASHGDSIPTEVTQDILDEFKQYAVESGFDAPAMLESELEKLEDDLSDIKSSEIDAQMSEIKRRIKLCFEDDWNAEIPFIVRNLRERFARQRGGVEAVYSDVRLRYDPLIVKALNILANPDVYVNLLTADDD